MLFTASVFILYLFNLLIYLVLYSDKLNNHLLACFLLDISVLQVAVVVTPARVDIFLPRRHLERFYF